MFQPSSNAVPTSFSEFLSGTAVDLIDWAPPARITSAALQLHSATKRSVEDANEEALRRSAGVNEQQQRSSRNETPTGTPRLSTPRANNNNYNPFASPPPAASQSTRFSPRSLHLMNGAVGVHSCAEAKFYNSPRWELRGAFHTSIGVAGFPLLYDTGLRWLLQASHKPSGVQCTAHAQLMRPVSASTAAWGLRVRQQSDAWDLSARSEGALYLVSGVATLWDYRGRTRAKELVVESDVVQSWLRRVRAGFGIHIKKDLASGANLLLGMSTESNGGVQYIGHIDVLRRLTCYASGPLYRWQQGGGGGEQGNVLPAVYGALRLRLNTISFESTTLEWALRTPLAPLPYFHWAPESIKLHLSQSSVGTMVGFVWKDLLSGLREAASRAAASHAEQDSPSTVVSRIMKKWPRIATWATSDVRMDLTVGLLVRERRTVFARGATPPSRGEGFTGGYFPTSSSDKGLRQQWERMRDGHAASSFVLLSFE